MLTGNLDTNNERERKQLKVFERKLYRRILGPIYGNKEGNCGILTNREMYASFKKTSCSRDNMVK